MFCYFHSALQIFESNKTCEIDPVKLKEGDNVEVNKVISGWIVVLNLAECVSYIKEIFWATKNETLKFKMCW